MTEILYGVQVNEFYETQRESGGEGEGNCTHSVQEMKRDLRLTNASNSRKAVYENRLPSRPTIQTASCLTRAK